MRARTTSSRRLRLTNLVLQRLARGSSSVEAEAAGLEDLISEGAVCFDIGAAYGLYTFTFASRVGPTGQVVSLEPLPGSAAFLRRAVRWTGATNVFVQQIALGAEQRQGTMSLPRRGGLPVHGRAFLADDADGFGPNSEFAGEKRLRVAVTTLDTIVEEADPARVDFIKIDVEGYEPAVLLGAERTIRRFRPILMIEIEDRHLRKFGADASTVVNVIQEHGYSMWVFDGGRWEPVEAVTRQSRNYLFTPL